MLERLDPERAVLQRVRFFTETIQVHGNACTYITEAGRDALDFLVTAKQDLPEVLEYLQELEGRVEEMQKTINKQVMWICDLQDEIEESC